MKKLINIPKSYCNENVTKPVDIFLPVAISIVPRIITLTCRTPSMRGFGSCDREWWNTAQRTFSLPRRQEAMLSLALAYSISGQPFYKRDDILSIVISILDFWCQLQHKDGSFDDLYRNEKAHVTAAFGLYAAAKTLLVLKNELKKYNNWSNWTKAIEKTCEWLSRNSDTVVVNHEAGAAAGMQTAANLLESEKWKEEAAKSMQRVINEQHNEGWFPEYGGADTGYLSLSLAYIAKYYLEGGKVNVLPMAENACRFLVNASLPDGSCGGEYCSRNTLYIIPHGIVTFSNVIEDAAVLLNNIRKACINNRLILPSYLDDQFCLANGYEYWLAALDAPNDFKVESTNNNNIFWRAPASGFVAATIDEVKVVANERKGGAYTFANYY